MSNSKLKLKCFMPNNRPSQSFWGFENEEDIQEIFHKLHYLEEEVKVLREEVKSLQSDSVLYKNLKEHKN